MDPWKWFSVRGSGPRLSYSIILLCLVEVLVWTHATSGAFVAAAPEETETKSFQQFASATAENFKHGDLREEAGAGQTRASITSLAKEGRHFSMASSTLQGVVATKANKPDGQATSGERPNPKRPPGDPARAGRGVGPRGQPQAPRNAGSKKNSRKGGGGDKGGGDSWGKLGGVWAAVAASVAVWVV